MVPTWVRWRIFLVIALGSFVSYVLRSNLSIAAPAMIADFALTEVQWGYVMAAFPLGYAVFQIPGGMAGDRWGPRRALTVIGLLWAVLTAITALVPAAASTGLVLVSLATVRFLVGAAHAPIFPVVNCVVERWFPPGRRALPVGLSSTALTLGIVASAPLLPGVISNHGWRAAFWLIAPLGLLFAGLWWWYSKDDPGDHPAVNRAELDLIRNGQLLQTGDLPPPPGWVRVLKNRDLLLLMLSYSCMNFVFYEVFSWFYFYLVEHRGFDTGIAGWVTSTQWLAGAVGAGLGGWLCDILCRRLGLRWGSRWPIIGGMLLSGAMLAWGAFSMNPGLAVAMLALCFFFNQLTEGSYWATSIAIGERFAGTAGGLLNTGANAMGALGAVLVPLFAERFGWTAAIASGSLFALAGAVLLLFVRADRPIAHR